MQNGDFMKRAVYTGSFDPITNGHMDIIRRASEIFDVLIVSVLNNKEKTPLFSVEERVKILEEATKDLPNVQIDSFSQTNRMLSHGKIDTVFLTTSLEYAYLSSSAIKQIASFDGDITPCVPDFVADLIYEKYRQKKLSGNRNV